jgi:hypothetical protein
MTNKTVTFVSLAAAMLATTLALTTVSAHAGQREDTINANQAAQQARIDAARLKGDLTRREYRQLEGEQARIAELERQAKADGRVSRNEYDKIHDAQINASKHIKSESTDRQVSFLRRWLSRHPG